MGKKKNQGSIGEFFEIASLIMPFILSFLFFIAITIFLFQLFTGDFSSGVTSKKKEKDTIEFFSGNYYDLQEASRSNWEYWEKNPEAYKKHKKESIEGKKYYEENYKQH